MNTVFLLMAEFETATIPLSQIAERYLHMNASTANRKAIYGKLDIPTFKMDDGQKSPRFVHVQDLAEFIDKKREQAKKELESVNN